MKRIKLGFVALAILFACLSSFTSANHSNNIKKSARGWLYLWFEYVGYGNPYDPNSYRTLIFTPSCFDLEGSLCAIYAEADFLLLHPSAIGLYQLGMQSNSFTCNYSGNCGQVRMVEY